jgi:hypothetical protein
MSKFIDRLKEALHPAPQPMGFGRRAETKKKARLVLVASLDKEYKEGLNDVFTAADAVLLPIDSPAKDIEALSKAANSKPAGEWFSGSDDKKLEALSKNGCDFLVFRPDKAGLNLLRYEKIGKILEVDMQMEDALLRAVATLPVDAVFVRHDASGQSFTFQDLMVYRHFADFTSKPVMVTVTSPLTDKELLVLWEAGVDSIAVAAGPGAAGELLMKLRQEIDKVVFPAERRAAKHEGVVPPVREEAPAPQKEEEDGDEEEDE